MTNEKKAFRVNLVDVLLTLLIAAVIAVGVYMIATAFGVDASDKDDMVIEYTLVFRGVQPEFIDKVQVGETVIDAQKRINMGTVTQVYHVPYTKDVYDEETQSMQEATHPDFVTLYFTIEAPGYIAQDMYYINGIKMAVGNGHTIHMKHMYATGYVSDMRIK